MREFLVGAVLGIPWAIGLVTIVSHLRVTIIP